MNKKVLLVVTAIVVIASNVWAADPNWTGLVAGANNWFTTTNWNPNAAPTSISKATVNLVGANAPAINSGTANANQLFVAESAGNIPGAQTVTVATGGTLYVRQEIVLGYGDTDNGTLHVTGGTVDCNHLFLGFNPGSTGNLHIDSGTVNVAQMFGPSWRGGDGNVQLDGGTLQTEQFTFEANDVSGTAIMDITGGSWVQNHFWYHEIKSLVWNGKITGYGSRSNAVVTWDPAGIGHTTVTAVASPAFPNLIIVKKDGTGDFTTIQNALDATVKGSIVEVRDNGVYTENLQFKASTPSVDANYVTLQSGSTYRPTIRLTGIDSNTVKYITVKAVGTTIQGFDIDFTGSASSTDGNSAIISAVGGASTIRDCKITGPVTMSGTGGWIRGIVGVANIEDVNLSGCRIGLLCDANLPRTGFSYSISDSHIHNCYIRGILFSNSTAVMDDCLVERCGNDILPGAGGSGPGGNILINGDANGIGGVNLLIKNSTIREAIAGRNINMEAVGRVDINDCTIMDALGTQTHSDEILQYRGTLNLNRCIIRATKMRCVNFASSPSGTTAGFCNIDHCDLRKETSLNDDWAVTTTNPDANVTVTNSIVTGSNGYLRNAGFFNSNFNDIFCTNRVGGGSVVLGPNDLNINPFYIHTASDDPNGTFFKLQPYSPVLDKDEFGSYMGSQGPMAGFEKWPADLDGTYGVDFKDFAMLASQWGKSNIIPAGPNHPLENFEIYTATGTPGVWAGSPTLLGKRSAVDANCPWEVVARAPFYNFGTNPPPPFGSSTLTLLKKSGGYDVNDGNNAMRWVYDVNVSTNPPGQYSTEILVRLAHVEDINYPYDRIRVLLKRHSGNSSQTMTPMYAKFMMPNSQGKYISGNRIVNSVLGGSTSEHPDEWYPWTINLHNLAGWENNWTVNNMKTIGAFIFGIRGQPEAPYGGPGKGTIDVDKIELIDLPGCSAPIASDLNGDCKVDFGDLADFLLYWLDGK